MKKQITFYGRRCEAEAIDWITNLSKCFDIIKMTMRTYEVKCWNGVESRCQIKIKYL